MPLSPAGAALLDKPLLVDAHSSNFMSVTDIGTNGIDYVIVAATVSAIRTHHVDPSGKVLSSAEVRTARTAVQAHIAWRENRFLLVYADGSDGPIVGVFLDRTGKPQPERFTISDSGRSQQIAIASDGRDFLVAISSADVRTPDNSVRGRVYTVAIGGDGSVGVMNTIGGTTDAFIFGRALTYTGRTYALVWNDRAEGFHGANEVPLDATGQPTHGATVMEVGGIAQCIRATADGAVAFIGERNSIRAMRFDVNGEPVDSEPAEVFRTPEGGVVDAASSDSDVVAVWGQRETAPSFIPLSIVYGARVDFSRTQSGASLAQAAVDESLVAVATADRIQLLLYVVHRPLQTRTLYARRFIGGVAIEEPILILEPLYADPTASIATNGSDFLIVLSDYSGRIVARLLRNGSPVSSEIDLGRGTESPFAIWSGKHYLVVWTEFNERPAAGALYERLLATRISALGDVLDAEPRVITASPGFDTAYARIVATPRGLVALFAHGVPMSPCFGTRTVLRYDVYAARMTSDGDFVGEPIPIAMNASRNILGDVAVNPAGEIFLNWIEQALQCPVTQTAHAAVIGLDLAVQRTVDFPTPQHRTVAWSGTAFVSTWTADQVYVQPYSHWGEALSEPIALTDTDAVKGVSLIASIPGGVFVSYTRPLPEESGSDAQRVEGRTILDVHRRRAVSPR
jgi:hypothetical protein